MDDLFSRLFRRKLENFLTEALVTFLNRLTLAEQRKFVLNLLLAERTQQTLLDNFVAQLQAAKLRWQSEVPIHWRGFRGRPDIVLFDASKSSKEQRPLLLIESKIRAAYTTHGGDADDEESSLGQLELFGRWLKSKNPLGALVLLTYGREPPEGGFLEKKGDQVFGVKLRAVSLWVTLSQWMSEGTMALTDPIAAFLRSQMQEFLTREGICGMTRKDTEMLNRYLCAREKIDEDGRILDDAERALDEIMEDAKRELDGSAPKYEDGALLSNQSFDHEEISLRFGFISCPNASWGVIGSRKLLACVIVFLKGKAGPDLTGNIEKKFKGWGKKGGDGYYSWWIKTKEASVFLSASRGFAPAFVDWARDELDGAKKRIAQPTKKVKGGKSKSVS